MYIRIHVTIHSATNLFTLESVEAPVPEETSEAHRNAAFSLLLPGKVLYLNALLHLRKFRDRGNKGGAVRGFELLERQGLGLLVSTRLQRGANMVKRTCVQ